MYQAVNAMAARCRYREVLDNIEARVQRAYRGREPSALIPRMTPSAELDKLVSPKTRCAHWLTCGDATCVCRCPSWPGWLVMPEVWTLLCCCEVAACAW